MPNERFTISVRFERDGKLEAVEVPLTLPSPMMPAELTQSVDLPEPFAPVRPVQYLPRAVLDQDVTPDPTGRAGPAIRLLIEGPSQSYERWLLEGDPERDRLTSFIGAWRYVAAADKGQRDALYAQFEHEQMRDPTLQVWRDSSDTVYQVAAKAGHVETIEDFGCTVRVKRFFPDFGIDEKTKKPTNRSEKRSNPAVLVAIEREGGTDERWVFARFPEFRATGDEAMPLHMRLDCPVEHDRPLPGFVLMTVDRQRHEVWMRHQDRTESRSLSVEENIDIPDSRYVFRVTRFVPSGRLVEQYRGSDERGAVTALRVEMTDASGQAMSTWLELDKPRVVSTVHGPVEVSFRKGQPGARGGHE
jgi:hypothetical protein